MKITWYPNTVDVKWAGGKRWILFVRPHAWWAWKRLLWWKLW